ncbi:MAG: transposase [Thermoanaerobaculia bacterium]
MGAHLVFADESGFLLTPTVAKSWAPVGKTPVVRHFDRRDRISAISGISVSPKRRRLNLYFQLHEKNIQQAEVRDFLRHLLKHLRGYLIVLWDGGRPHQGRLVRDFCRRSKRLRLDRLPAYAPELNPDEGVWKLAKQTLANGRPRDRYDLTFSLLDALEAIRTSQNNLRGCITHSALPPFSP